MTADQALYRRGLPDQTPPSPYMLLISGDQGAVAQETELLQPQAKRDDPAQSFMT